MFDFEYQLKVLPDKPGVYIMKSSSEEIIYVGKAKILKNRVRQYFQSSKNHSQKVSAMVRNISEFEYIVTDTEMEALILECNLIKKHRPRYNILLKDDKHFPFIKITSNEDFPKVFITRHYAPDGSKYFGPYVDSGALYETMELIKKIFPIRTCKKLLKENMEPIKPCLNYHIGLCKAPCAGLVSKEEYSNIVKEAIDLLNGKDKNIAGNLQVQMEKAAENLEYEKAAILRDKIKSVNKIIEKQKIFTGGFEDEDFIQIYSDEKDSCAQVFFLRGGRISGREHFIIENTSGQEKKEILSYFIKEFYGATAYIPKNIYSEDFEDRELIEEWFSTKAEHRVNFKNPQRGEKKALLGMVMKNAKITLENFRLKLLQDKALHKIGLEQLASLLNLDYLPSRIEAFDISNIQGVDSVGTMVVFEQGRPKNSDYRRFKINTVKGANDYESMREILTRRFQHGIEEIKAMQENQLNHAAGKFSVFPDVIMMDGGRGQVNIALDVLEKFGLKIPVCGMVKDDKHRTRGLIYNNQELYIRSEENVMKLITRVQDEVHRFAITYHRTLRNKRVLHSVLEDIPSIGQKRRVELLKRFGSVENIKAANLQQLLETPSIDKKAAESIKQYFKDNS